MLTKIDSNNGMEVQKVSTPSGKVIRYQVQPTVAGDSDKVTCYRTLADARQAIGKLSNGKVVANES